jgi:hypothetical protein
MAYMYSDGKHIANVEEGCDAHITRRGTAALFPVMMTVSASRLPKRLANDLAFALNSFMAV